MRYEILLAPEAIEDLQSLNAKVRGDVKDAIERYQPTRVSTSRIKQLRGLSRPQYRLRAGEDIRVLYDVTHDTVEVLAIIPKSQALQWLERYGDSDEESGSV